MKVFASISSDALISENKTFSYLSSYILLASDKRLDMKTRAKTMSPMIELVSKSNICLNNLDINF